MSRSLNIFLGLISILVISSCSDLDSADDLPTVAELINEKVEFTLLREAMIAADLLNQTEISPVTIFSPSQPELRSFLEDNGYENFSEVPQDSLRHILLYHMQNAVLSQEDLLNSTSGYLKTPSNGGPGNTTLAALYLFAADVISINEEASLTGSETRARNGYIHSMDNMLNLPDMVDLLEINPNFTILMEALARVDLLDDLRTGGPFTFFAPTNEAFEAYYEETAGVSDLDDITNTALRRILRSHIAAGNFSNSDFIDGRNILQNLEGDEIQVSLDLGNITVNSSDNFLVLVDVQARNGVNHFINQFIEF